MTRASTFAPLPPGARDLLPPVLGRRRALTERLLGIFESWGYEQVATPAVEYFEVFGRGLTEGERQRCLRFIAPGDGEVVALRSDVTPQIARLVAQHLGDRLAAGELLRLSYAADVIRAPLRAGEAAEEHQVGVELIGDVSAGADAELIALGHEALVAAGVEGLVLDLAHVGVAGALLDELDLEDADRRALITRLARKDLAGIDGILAAAGRAPAARAAALALARLHGGVDVLGEARRRLGAVASGPLAEVEAAVEALSAVAPAVLDRLTLDLGEVRGHDYYSGLRLRGWAPGASRPLLRGGRYDRLLRRYGVDAPATGLVIDLDVALGLSQETANDRRRGACLIAAEGGDPGLRAIADAEARRARARGLRAWVEPGLDRAGAEAVAARVGAEHVITVAAGDTDEAKVRRWRRRDGGWEPLAAEERSER